MSKLSTPVVVVIGLVAVTVVIVAGVVSNSALNEDIEPVVLESASGSEPIAVNQGAGKESRQLGRDGIRAIDADDEPTSRAELKRVKDASLTIVGGGVVTDVDRSDDLGEAYEVEVLTQAGEVDVALDRNLDRVPNLRYDD